PAPQSQESQQVVFGAERKQQQALKAVLKHLRQVLERDVDGRGNLQRLVILLQPRGGSGAERDAKFRDSRRDSRLGGNSVEFLRAGVESVYHRAVGLAARDDLAEK